MKKPSTRMRNAKRGRRKTLLPSAVWLVMLLIGACMMLMPLGSMRHEVAQDAMEYEQLKVETAVEPVQGENAETVMPRVNIPAPTADVIAPSLETPHTGIDLAACHAQNNDFVAWLQIPNTPVDYPVVSTDDTKHYLSHTFAGKKSYLGTLFSLSKTDYSLPSRNIAIYGHHIRSNDDVMFSPLLRYKDQAFYAGHELIYLDSLYHSAVYKIFAVINMRNGDWEPSTASYDDDAAFLHFVNSAKAQALYPTDVAVEADDEILTLITCDRSYIPLEGRLIVMAVRIE